MNKSKYLDTRTISEITGLSEASIEEAIETAELRATPDKKVQINHLVDYCRFRGLIINYQILCRAMLNTATKIGTNIEIR